MQTCARISTLLLLLLPYLLLLTPAAQAHGPVKVGCLNYGHSCLGAHGKRGSWPPSAPRPPAAALLAPFLQGRASPRSLARSWQDKVMTQHHQQPQQEQQQQQQQQQVIPLLYDDVAFARVPASIHRPLPAQLKPDAAALEEDDMLYYGTYEDDYGDHRAKRSVDGKEEKEATPTLASLSCLLFSRRC